MTCLPALLLQLRAMDPAVDRHCIRMTPEQSHELADFLAVKLALPWRRPATRWTGDVREDAE